jgi:hypothetical protein
MYCIEMGKSQDEFWHSSIACITTMIDMYADEMQMKAAAMNGEQYEPKNFKSKEEVIDIKSMKEIKGW